MSVDTFAKQLKEGTKKSHSAAENTTFVKSFLRGVVNKESYRALVNDLYFVYCALEEEVGGVRLKVKGYKELSHSIRRILDQQNHLRDHGFDPSTALRSWESSGSSKRSKKGKGKGRRRRR